MSVEQPRPTILIVEDDESSATFLSIFLGEDYDTIIASNGRRAAETIENIRPDLVLLDVMMPELNGYQVFDKIKSRYPDNPVPVIFITSVASPEDELKALQDGAVDFIGKPFQPGIVKARVRLHLELQFKTKQLEFTNAELERLARVDPLTQLANRRYFDEIARKEIERARRHHTVLSLVAVDIDHFKKINDGHGHLVGDKVLAKFAKFCSEFIRSCDFVARVGGEEFVILLPNTVAEGARAMAERLRKSVSELNIPLEDNSTLTLTLSCGVSEYSAADKDIRNVLRRADTALYQAKSAGRNKVIVARQQEQLESTAS